MVIPKRNIHTRLTVNAIKIDNGDTTSNDDSSNDDHHGDSDGGGDENGRELNF